MALDTPARILYDSDGNELKARHRTGELPSHDASTHELLRIAVGYLATIAELLAEAMDQEPPKRES